MAEANDSVVCQFCWHGSEVESVAGKLHAEKDSGRMVSAHHRCMQYASGLTQYKSQEFGGFDINEVKKEIARGNKLRCYICKKNKEKKSKGASCGCAVGSCRKTFHFPCAHNAGMTKRLVVTRNRTRDEKDKFVLYRVFCCKEHEVTSRTALRDELHSSKCGAWYKKEEDKESDGSQAMDSFSSVSLHNSSEIVLSPPAPDRPQKALTLSPKETAPQLTSPKLASTPVMNSSDMDKAVDSILGDDEEHDAGVENDPKTASKSSRQNKTRRQSGFERPKSQRVKNRVSHSPLCSPIEEMSDSSKFSETETHSCNNGDAAEQILAVSETDASAAVMVHMLPGEESAENKSPNIPPESQKVQSDNTKSLNNCFVYLENGLVCEDKHVQNSPGGSPSKANPQHYGSSPHKSPSRRHALSSPRRQFSSQSPSSSPFKAPLVSPTRNESQHNSPSSLLQVSPSKSLQGHPPMETRNTESHRGGDDDDDGLPIGNREPESSPVKNSASRPAKTVEFSPTRSLSSPKRSDQHSARNGLVHSSPNRSPNVDTVFSGSSVVLQQPSPGRSVRGRSTIAQQASPEKSPECTSLPQTGLTRKDSAAKPHSERDNLDSAKASRRSVQAEKDKKKSDRVSQKGLSSRKSTQESDASTTDVDSSIVTGDSSAEKSGRKRKLNDSSTSSSGGNTNNKRSSRRTEDTASASQACVLLIPSNKELFEHLESSVTGMAAEMLDVAPGSLCVWQHITMQTLPPQLILFFILDLVKELESGKSETLLNLLFDAEHLSAKVDNYVTQAQIFQNLSDEKAQKDVQMAVWQGVERIVKNLPMVHLLTSEDQDLKTLAVDARRCADSQQLLALLQAYKGMFWWTPDTEAHTFHISPDHQRLAAQSEALTLQVWLTKVNPVTEVTILPAEELLLDRAKLEASSEFMSLVQYVKDKTHVPMVVQLEEGAGEDNSVQTVIPLLIFQPVDFVILNFQQFFKRACHEFFRTRGLMRVLALLPLCNLNSLSYESIARLMTSDSGGEVLYSVSVCSAFCPETQPTSLVLLEVSVKPEYLESTALVDEMQSKPEAGVVAKRKRGRPKKTDSHSVSS